jgi:hypothetical protein
VRQGRGPVGRDWETWVEARPQNRGRRPSKPRRGAQTPSRSGSGKRAGSTSSPAAAVATVWRRGLKGFTSVLSATRRAEHRRGSPKPPLGLNPLTLERSKPGRSAAPGLGSRGFFLVRPPCVYAKAPYMRCGRKTERLPRPREPRETRGTSKSGTGHRRPRTRRDARINGARYWTPCRLGPSLENRSAPNIGQRPA